LAAGTLELDVGSGSQGRLSVNGTVTIAGGTLHIKFVNGYKPAAGDTLNIIAAGSFNGRFDKITVDGFSATPTYSNGGLQLVLGA
jgi:hypothetical protein